MLVFTGALQLGLIYGILALGVYVSFKILNIPDLSAEGTFTLGLAVSAAMTVQGHPFWGIVLAVLAGAAAGACTGLLQTKFGIHPVLSGILTMSGLYSINLLVMGSRSNLTLMGPETVFKMAVQLMPAVDKEIVKALVSLVFCVVCFVVLAVFFKTHAGLCIRATGDNEDMVTASSINVQVTKIAGLAASNAFIALSGALITQQQGFADINSGVGIVVVGLASVIIGEVLCRRHGVTIGLLSAVAGSIIYRFIMAAAISASAAYMLKLVSAVIVGIALSIPAMQQKWELSRIKRGAKENAEN